MGIPVRTERHDGKEDLDDAVEIAVYRLLQGP